MPEPTKNDAPVINVHDRQQFKRTVDNTYSDNTRGARTGGVNFLTEIPARVGSTLSNAMPFVAPERAVETLFHPIPPTAPQFQGFSLTVVDGTGQADAAAAKNNFTQAWDNVFRVFSRPLPQPGANPSAVNNTASPLPPMPFGAPSLPTPPIPGRGTGMRVNNVVSRVFGWMFPNG